LRHRPLLTSCKGFTAWGLERSGGVLRERHANTSKNVLEKLIFDMAVYAVKVCEPNYYPVMWFTSEIYTNVRTVV
jgi:hypothetical protein